MVYDKIEQIFIVFPTSHQGDWIKPDLFWPLGYQVWTESLNRAWPVFWYQAWAESCYQRNLILSSALI